MTRLAAARAAVADIDRALVANATSARAARAEVADLVRAGVGAAERARAERRVAALERERARLLDRRGDRARRVDELRDALVGDRRFESAVGELDGRVPITLLPVRLETRFSSDRSRLRVRIFPDTAHQDGHEPELTDQEIEAGKQYWHVRWQQEGPAQDSEAWRDIVRAFRPSRARWIAEVMTPTNVENLGTGDPVFPEPDERPAPWTRAPMARALPERWLVVGYRGGDEVVRKWGRRIADDLPMGPAPDLAVDDGAVDEPSDEQDALVVDDELRWIVDYDTAEARGMAITIEQGDFTSGRLDAGFDLLMVVGVDWTLDPGTAASHLEAHLVGHRYTDGLALLSVGTPTNVTADDPDPGGGDLDRSPELLDPTVVPEVTSASAGVRLREALGLPEGSVLETAPGAADTSDSAARHMNNALWAPTWGYFFEQVMRPLVATRPLRELHDHFRRFVRGRGPLPTLRLGAQPYGVLPVLAARNWRASDTGIDDMLMQRFPSLRAQWLHSASRVQGLADGAQPDEAVVDLLRQTPRSVTFRFRKATGRSLSASVVGLGLIAKFQEQLARLMLDLAGIDGRPAVVDIVVGDRSEALPVPLVTAGELSETEPLDPNYFAEVLAQLSRSGGFRRLVEDPATARSLLEALVRHAAQLEMARVTFELILDVEVAAGVVPRDTPILREREIHIAEQAPPRPDQPEEQASLLEGAETLLELALRPVSAVSGRRTVANHVATATNTELRRRVSTSRFANFRTSLDHLAKMPSAEVARLAAETLDCCSHRLDAWVTSVAARRLHDLRAASRSGTHLGGYGWVEDLRPSPTGTSLGYVHAPSVSQAATAAILRSGHLSRRASADSVLAIDLSSQRVAKAHAILGGMREGHPVGALLGYRFERGLRDRDLRLMQYVLGFRRAAPLDTSTDGFDDGQPLEAVAARDVADGVKLAERSRSNEAGLLDEVGVDDDDRPPVRAELAQLVDTLDAVSDVLVSESVNQAVLGNAERSAAALDAIDRQTGIPDVGVVRTPRTGIGIGHRVLLTLTDTVLPPAWAGLDDPRAHAEPHLNAWLARALGDPNFVRIRALATDADGATLGPPLDVRLSDLGLSPLSTVLAAMGGGANEATELQERFVEHLLDAVPDGTVGLAFEPGPPAGSPRSALGFAELMDLCASIGDFVASCRHGTAADLVAANEQAVDGLDAAELKQRADAAVAALRRARDDLPEPGENPDVPRLRSTLLALGDVGVRGAVPTSDDRDALVAQVEVVTRTADARLDELETREAESVRADDDPAAQVRHDLDRLHLIFGEGFPAAPVCRLANADEVGSSLSAAKELLDGDLLALTLWLEQHALVRPAVGRLLRALADVEMRGRGLDAAQLAVAQLPHRPGDRWVGLPKKDGVPLHAGATSVVVHSPAPLDAHAKLAIWVVDQWSEVIPRRTETTGVSFHFDAPGSRAPQSVLVAVPPDLTVSGWLLDDVIGSVREAQELTLMRSVDLDHLEAVGRFLPALYFAFNLEGKTPSLNLWGLADVATEFANAAFLERRGGSP